MAQSAPRRSLVDHVHEHLVAQLAAREIKKGDRVIAREIAELLEVSRTTVNKAVDRLIKEDLVAPDPGRHPIVVGVPAKLKVHDVEAFDFANQTDACYEALLEHVLRGEVKPGDIIKERGLAMEMQVNPATLRRAAEWLRNDGLLERLPRRGWRVCQLSGKDIRNAFEIRLVLEPIAIAQAVHQITDATLNEMHATTERLIALGENASVYDRRTADLDFHTAILDATGNKILAETLEPLIRKLLLITTVSFRYARAAKTFEEHLEIIAALRDRDEKTAVKRMKAHLRAARNHNQKIWE